MKLLGNLAHQLCQIYDNLDIVAAAAAVYFLVRARVHLKGAGRGALLVFLPPLCYFLTVTIVSLMGEASISERYYRPVLPLMLIFSALGLYCLGKDIKNRKVICVFLALMLIGFFVEMLRLPVRGHRRAQTEAGLWLRAHDPDYRGFVVSSYSQPAYYAGMEFLPERGARRVFHRLMGQGQKVKYFILEGDGSKWTADYVRKHRWPSIYHVDQRDLTIYVNPELADEAGSEER